MSCSWRRGLRALAVGTLAGCGGAASGPLAVAVGQSALNAGPTGFVQAAGNAAPHPAMPVLTVQLPNNPAPGDLIIVSVGASWPGPATQLTVTDTGGQTFQGVVGPTLWQAGNSGMEALFYGAGGTGGIIASLGTDAGYWFELRAFEYAGIESNSPVDAIAAAQGTLDAGPAQTLIHTVATGDLLFAVGQTDNDLSIYPGVGFEERFGPDSGGGAVGEDALATAPGDYTLLVGADSGLGSWCVQGVAFRRVQGAGDGGVRAPLAYAVGCGAAGGAGGFLAALTAWVLLAARGRSSPEPRDFGMPGVSGSSVGH